MQDLLSLATALPQQEENKKKEENPNKNIDLRQSKSEVELVSRGTGFVSQTTLTKVGYVKSNSQTAVDITIDLISVIRKSGVQSQTFDNH